MRWSASNKNQRKWVLRAPVQCEWIYAFIWCHGNAKLGQPMSCNRQFNICTLIATKFAQCNRSPLSWPTLVSMETSRTVIVRPFLDASQYQYKKKRCTFKLTRLIKWRILCSTDGNGYCAFTPEAKARREYIQSQCNDANRFTFYKNYKSES